MSDAGFSVIRVISFFSGLSYGEQCEARANLLLHVVRFQLLNKIWQGCVMPHQREVLGVRKVGYIASFFIAPRIFDVAVEPYTARMNEGSPRVSIEGSS